MSEENTIEKVRERVRKAYEEESARIDTEQPSAEPRLADGLADEEESGVSVRMVLSTETVLDVRFLQEYLNLPVRADAVTAAISISSMLLREIKQGGTIYVESRTGSKSKLSIRRGNNAD